MPAAKATSNGKAKLIQDLKNGTFAPLYIISGEESYLKEYYLGKLKESVIDPAFADFNLLEFEGKGLTVEQLTEAIDSYPAMSEKKLIIVTDFDLFKPPAGFADALPGILGDLPDYVCLVFYYDVIEGKPDKRTKLYKTLEKCACFAEFSRQEERELVTWLERRARAGLHDRARGRRLHDLSVRQFHDQSGGGAGKGRGAQHDRRDPEIQYRRGLLPGAGCGRF